MIALWWHMLLQTPEPDCPPTTVLFVPGGLGALSDLPPLFLLEAFPR